MTSAKQCDAVNRPIAQWQSKRFDPDQSAGGRVRPFKQLMPPAIRLGENSMNPIALTRREREVADLVCIGFSNKQIAQYLAISEGTVKLHLDKIYKKLSVRSRPALAALVMAESTLPMVA